MNGQIGRTKIPPCACGGQARHWWSPGWKHHKISCIDCDKETPAIDGQKSALDAWIALNALTTAEQSKGSEG